MAKQFKIGDKFPAVQRRSADNSVFTASLFFGKKIFYSFFRYSGCPACNLYFNQLQIRRKELEAKNIVLVALFEVELDILKEVLPKNYWGVFLADPEGKYYDFCGIERSSVKLNLGVLDRQYHDAMREGKNQMLEGVTESHMKDASGKRNRMPAQFLLDERGKVLKAHYGKNISDRMPVPELLNA